MSWPTWQRTRTASWHPTPYYKDGSYTGTGKGRGGDMEVTVTITDGKISDIVVNSHAESSDIGAPALDKLIQNAIAANSAEIDGAFRRYHDLRRLP